MSERVGTQRIIIGAVERVHLDETALVFAARVDTGARMSSIDARILAHEHDPERLVFALDDRAGGLVTLKRDVVRWITIKGRDRRPVVVLTFSLGGRQVATNVNLTDRSRMRYPLLLGRDALTAGNFLVDPAVEHAAPVRSLR